MLNNSRKNQFGFSIAELLVALVINLILLSALIGVFSTNTSHYTKVTKSDMLNQQLETALQLMENDIRRAGYWGNASNDIGSGQNTNPFMSAATDVTVVGNCILFAYDYDNNGSLPSVSSSSDDERYGYRLNSNTIQTRPPGAPFDCSASSNSWENVTDPNIVKITTLTFNLVTKTVPAGQASNTIVTRSVDIQITGQLVTDATVTKTLNQHVRIRNDKFTP